MCTLEMKKTRYDKFDTRNVSNITHVIVSFYVCVYVCVCLWCVCLRIFMCVHKSVRACFCESSVYVGVCVCVYVCVGVCVCVRVFVWKCHIFLHTSNPSCNRATFAKICHTYLTIPVCIIIPRIFLKSYFYVFEYEHAIFGGNRIFFLHSYNF